MLRSQNVAFKTPQKILKMNFSAGSGIKKIFLRMLFSSIEEAILF